MRINIGNNNEIKKSVIGNNNKIHEERKSFFKKIIEIIISIIVGLVVGYCIYKFGWNK